MSYTENHLREAEEIIRRLDVAAIDKIAELLAGLRERGGRLFFLGVGGSAANCSHAASPKFRPLPSTDRRDQFGRR